MASIGCNNFHFAVMTTEETKTAAPTYDDTTGMTAIPNLVKVDVQPQTNSATNYGDNGPVLTATSLGEITVNVETVDIEPAILAKILGHTYDEAKKTIVYNANDVAPYVAIGFASQLNDGSKTKFVKLFKGKFQEPTDEPQTKGASIEFKNPTITGKFVMLNNNKNWKLVQYADNDEVDTVATAFFKTVLPTV
mgnify:CR=1 FL=1